MRSGGDGVNECLILLVLGALRYRERLPVSLFAEGRASHIRNPELDKARLEPRLDLLIVSI